MTKLSILLAAVAAAVSFMGCTRLEDQREGHSRREMDRGAASVAADHSSEAARSKCGAADNSRDAPCDISFLSLIASPESYSQRWVRVVAYYPGKPVKMMTLDPVRWDYGDYPSGVVIDDAALSQLGDAGYYSVVARFEYSDEVPIDSQGAYTQLGFLREMRQAVKRTPLSLRVADCSPSPCPVNYVDGVLPIVIKPEN
jgi:hypothetical protein